MVSRGHGLGGACTSSLIRNITVDSPRRIENARVVLRVAKKDPKTVCQNIAPAQLPSFLSRQPEIVYHSQRRALDEDMDDELDFGDILPAPGGGTNAHDDTPGAGPEYLADQRGADVRPSDHTGQQSDGRDGASTQPAGPNKRVVVKIASRDRNDGRGRDRAPSRDRNVRGPGEHKPVRVVVRRVRRSRSRSPPPASGNNLRGRLDLPRKGKGKRQRDDDPMTRDERQKKNLERAFCCLCGACGSHYIENCPDRKRDKGKCMICGEDHAIGDCPQKKVNPNKKDRPKREEREERRNEKKKARREERGAGEEGDEEDGEVAGNSTEVVEKKSGGVKDRFCPLCGAVTHFIEKCPDRKRDKKAGECMICGEAHAIRDCPERKVNPKAGNRSEKGGKGRGGRGRGKHQLSSETTISSGTITQFVQL